MKFYPTFFYPRSGSTVVDNLIGQHPQVLSLNEPFNRYDNKPIVRNDNYENINFKHFMLPVINNIPLNLNKKNCIFQYNILQFKYFMNEVDIVNEKHIFFIKKHFNKLIIIRRKNLLKQLVSIIIAYEYEKWSYHTSESILSNKITLPLELDKVYLNEFLNGIHLNKITLIDFLTFYDEELSKLMRFITDNNIQLLDIIYEEHIEQSPLVAVKMIEEFLGINQYNDYNIPLKKNTIPIEESLVNYTEVFEYLKNSKHYWMLK